MIANDNAIIEQIKSRNNRALEEEKITQALKEEK